jgi:hypothetical protein
MPVTFAPTAEKESDRSYLVIPEAGEEKTALSALSRQRSAVDVPGSPTTLPCGGAVHAERYRCRFSTRATEDRGPG